MFAKFPDETLFEVLLMSCNIGDRSMVALVQFVPHGSFDASAAVDLHPVLVPAEWFSELMPASLFLDIPNDAADISPFAELIIDIDCDPDSSPSAELGSDLASRWRARRRPIATTFNFVMACLPVTPPHLLNFALDAAEALASGSTARENREKIATFCELIAHHLSANSRGDETVRGSD